MAIVVFSPFNGQPVKVREADVGRAIRDAEGRFFYVLKRGDGEGYYGSPTRRGGPEHEMRARELAEAWEAAHGVVDPESVEEAATASITDGPAGPAKGMHDATGRRRRNGPFVVAILVLLIVAVMAWMFIYGPFSPEAREAREDAAPQQQQQPQPAPNGAARPENGDVAAPNR